MDAKTFDRMTTGPFCRRLFAFCDSLGISTINVEYSGGGDSGGVDNIELEFDNKKNNRIISTFFKDVFEEELGNPIYDRHGSFADGGGYSVNGTVVYSAKKKAAWIEGTDNYYEYHETKDGEEEEETCSEESWEEMIYEEDEGENNEDAYENEDREYDFVFAYAKLMDQLGGEPLCEVCHNQLSAAAIAGNENAKEYMAWSGSK